MRPLPFELGLSIEGVSFRYEGADRDTLTNVCLHIRPGESIGIAGATGSGKTTLIDLIARLLQPAAGRIMVDGQDLREHTREWQCSLGVVSQTVFLIDDTIRRNVALGVFEQHIDDRRVEEVIRLACLEDFVRSLPEGLETTVGERGVRLSGGQRQRVAVARALYRRPQVLILDEGTAALDTTTESRLLDGLSSLRGTLTVVHVAHRLSTLEKCDRVLHVEGGRVAEVGQGPSSKGTADGAA